MTNPVKNLQRTAAEYKLMSAKDKKRYMTDMVLNNALYILMTIFIIYTAIEKPNFLTWGSFANLITLVAAYLPLALGIAGTIVLTGTDLSAGRVVGLTAAISGVFLQKADFANKMFQSLPEVNWWWITVTFLAVLAVGAVVGFVNGFFVAKFSLHPFIVTLSTQLITYGIILWFFALNGNNGQPISGLSKEYKNFVGGEMFRLGGVAVPRYVLYAVVLTALMWFIWNKTTFGKNMFAVGSNAEAAKVSGVNVFMTTVLVHTLAGAMYGYAGFIEGVRAGSVAPSTGLNAECDAIAACVIGGVSFVGGTGKISGIIMGVFVLRIIFVALTMLGVDSSSLYIIKGAIILCACALDMRKYLVKKIMNENNTNSQQEQQQENIPPFRGLYRHVNISVKALDRIIILCIAVILIVVGLELRNPGFTITFDSKGGTDVPSQNQMYGELLDVPEDPTREGYEFTGWYADAACDVLWDESIRTIESDLTLYAGWEKIE